MRILGIDPGSICCGYGIIDYKMGKCNYVTSGCIKVGGMAMALRLQHIYLDVSQIISTYQPNHVAIEKVFLYKNPASALKLGQARGAAIVACVGLDVAEYAPRQIKQAVVGYGNAAKIQVQAMIQVLLSLSAKPSSDAADALAVAVCHTSYTQQYSSQGIL